MWCNTIATGILEVAKEIDMSKPIIICLQGINDKETYTWIEGSGYGMILADDLDNAAEKAVGVAGIVAK
jgi:succinyl-CoA synthetase beta subunit